MDARPKAAQVINSRSVVPYRNVVEDTGGVSFIVPKYMTGKDGPVKYLGGFDIKEMLSASLGATSSGAAPQTPLPISAVKMVSSTSSSKQMLEAAEQAAQAVAGGTGNSRALRAAAAAASIIRRKL